MHRFFNNADAATHVLTFLNANTNVGTACKHWNEAKKKVAGSSLALKMYGLYHNAVDLFLQRQLPLFFKDWEHYKGDEELYFSFTHDDHVACAAFAQHCFHDDPALRAVGILAEYVYASQQCKEVCVGKKELALHFKKRLQHAFKTIMHDFHTGYAVRREHKDNAHAHLASYLACLQAPYQIMAWTIEIDSDCANSADLFDNDALYALGIPISEHFYFDVDIYRRCAHKAHLEDRHVWNAYERGLRSQPFLNHILLIGKVPKMLGQNEYATLITTLGHLCKDTDTMDFIMNLFEHWVRRPTENPHRLRYLKRILPLFDLWLKKALTEQFNNFYNQRVPIRVKYYLRRLIGKWLYMPVASIASELNLKWVIKFVTRMQD